jgi:hypothetical protein
VADREGAAYHQGLDAWLNKRHWLRKPQYQFGWDWNPRLINVGITGPARLEWAKRIRLDQVAARQRHATRLRLVRLFRRGWSGVMVAVLTGEPVPLPRAFHPEPWAALPHPFDKNIIGASYDDAA